MSARRRFEEDAGSALTLGFMLAAHRRELRGMQELAQTCELVSKVGQLVHALQKERGQAALQLTSATDEQRQRWLDQEASTSEAQNTVYDRLASELTNDRLPLRRARWLHATAHALHALDGLPQLRAGMSAGRMTAEEAIAGYSAIVGSLLGVVIEALEGPADPQITRQLVALLNFMQAKELCGQERALGVAGFALGRFDADRQAQMKTLAQAQVRSFDLFKQHASDASRDQWQALSAGDVALVRLREMAVNSDAEVAPELAQAWFDVCSARIDALHGLEQALTTELAQSCRDRVADNEQLLSALSSATDLQNPADAIRSTVDTSPYIGQPLVYTLVGRPMDAAVNGDAIGDAMARSVLDVLLAQGQRLHEADLALAEARRAQQERRRIEQAKWWLVTHYQLSESNAQERLQRTAMNSGLALIEVADRILLESAKTSPPSRS